MGRLLLHLQGQRKGASDGFKRCYLDFCSMGSGRRCVGYVVYNFHRTIL
jgi:hypothetical protein